ncbi:restriction endonuclease subunit S [Streptomyces sp. NPDC001966]
MDDVITLVRRPVLPEADKEYREIGIRSFGNGIFHKEPVPGHEIAAKKVFRIEPNDLVFSNVFGWEGAVAMASEAEQGMIGSHRFMTYLVNEEIADARYLLPYFYGGPGLDVIRQASPGSAGRNRTLGIKTFGGKRVSLPELAEQRRVADKLDAAAMHIQQATRAKEHSRSLALQHADALFRSVERNAPLTKALKESSDFVAVDPDASYRTAGILNRGRGLFLRPVVNGSDTKYPRYNRLHKDQFVYSKLFGWEGSLAVVTDDFAGVHVSHEFPTFDIDPEVADIEYVTHLARWRGLHDSLKDQGTGMGSRRQRVNVGRLLATEVPLPGLPEQRRIAKQLTLSRKVTDGGAAQVEQLAVLRRTLLDAAFSGRL